jgi:hypothetical protein
MRPYYFRRGALCLVYEDIVLLVRRVLVSYPVEEIWQGHGQMTIRGALTLISSGVGLQIEYIPDQFTD